MKHFNTLLTTLLLSLTLSSCSENKESASADADKQLLIYCGITMVKPMTEIAKIIEKEKNCHISLTKGGSEDLYKSLDQSRLGDLYLPGSASYRKRHLEEGLLGEFRHVGFNQAALMVPKGNPKGVKADLNELLRDDLSIVICNPESGSIGRETKRLLDLAGIYQPVFEKAAYLTTDSRNLNRALKNGDADLIVNWRATAFFEENQTQMEVVDLPIKQAEPKKLLINLLKFSAHPDIAKRFMEYAASSQGQAIFRKYGFLDNQTVVD